MNTAKLASAKSDSAKFESALDQDDIKLVADIRECVQKTENKVRNINEKTDRMMAEVKKARGTLFDAQRKMFKLTDNRSKKQTDLDRNEFKIKQIDDRLRTIEHNIDHTKNSLRTEIRGPDEMLNAQKRLMIAYQQQQERHTRILRLLRRRDHVVSQLKVSTEKDQKYQERMQGLLDRLKNQMQNQDKVKKSIVVKVDNIKGLHQNILNLEPKLRQAHTRMRRVEVICFDLEDKINRKEEEHGKIKVETEALREDINQAQVKYEILKGQSFKGIDVKKQLIETIMEAKV
jgi:chromosome segregation ATPase